MTAMRNERTSGGADVSSPSCPRCVLDSVWTRLLGEPPQASTSNFFTAGGSSLTVFLLCAEIEAALGVPLDPVEVFSHPSYSELAATIAAQLTTRGVSEHE